MCALFCRQSRFRDDSPISDVVFPRGLLTSPNCILVQLSRCELLTSEGRQGYHHGAFLTLFCDLFFFPLLFSFHLHVFTFCGAFSLTLAWEEPRVFQAAHISALWRAALLLLAMWVLSRTPLLCALHMIVGY
jgi:hypothetical protein